TRTRPADDDLAGLAGFHAAEQAKRRLVVELDARGLPLTSKKADPVDGLAFDLLNGAEEKVVIGHDEGVITIDVAESDDLVRTKVRVRLDEPYRTMLGHFRHEVGHYYEWQLVRGDRIAACRALFGDESADYAAAIERHYASGPPPGWEEDFLSTYATMHPFEDFAETFAHYLHISDTVETAAAYGLTTVDASVFSSFRDLVLGVWVPLSAALNQINRSMGRNDLYPFVIPAPVLDKLEFVSRLVADAEPVVEAS
ncbi:MAG: putative zinc-binding metallopeptidase, partial [Marmoricola sp.]